jgi:hypothetical protein
MSAVEQRPSVVTLGVRARPRALLLHELGWVTRAGPEEDVVFFQAGGLVAPQNVSRRSDGRGEPGGYSSASPDGHPWGVAPNLDEDGAVTLPS